MIAAFENRIAQLEQQKLVLAEWAASIGALPLRFEKILELATRFPEQPCKLRERGGLSFSAWRSR